MKINKKVSFDRMETIKNRTSIIMCRIMYKRTAVNGEHYRKSMAIDTQFTWNLTDG